MVHPAFATQYPPKVAPMPVSYTHLDVYKRQGTASPTFFKPGGFKISHIVGNIDLSRNLTDQVSISIGSEARNETYTIIAVSYTHLDVYKRQGMATGCVTGQEYFHMN